MSNKKLEILDYTDFKRLQRFFPARFFATILGESAMLCGGNLCNHEKKGVSVLGD